MRWTPDLGRVIVYPRQDSVWNPQPVKANFTDVGNYTGGQESILFTEIAPGEALHMCV